MNNIFEGIVTNCPTSVIVPSEVQQLSYKAKAKDAY